MKNYECIKQDTTKTLKVGKIYNIKNNVCGTPCIYDDHNSIMYILGDYLLQNNFKEIKKIK